MRQAGDTDGVTVLGAAAAAGSTPAAVGARATDARAGRSVYALENNQAEDLRLRVQALNLRKHTQALLEPVELPPGASAIDLGCGPGGAFEPLSAKVGAKGRVVGVEVDPGTAVLARTFAKARELANVEVVTADASDTGLEDASFDLVHTRLLLVNISAPQQVILEMARLARPGGWIVVLEPDIGLRVCQPWNPSVARLAGLLASAYLRDGADAHLGRRLPHLLASAGLVRIGLEARAEVCPPGHAQRTVIADLVQDMRAKILEHRLIDELELAQLDRTAREHLDDPETVSIPVTYFLAWARKPPRPA